MNFNKELVKIERKSIQKKSAILKRIKSALDSKEVQGAIEKMYREFEAETECISYGWDDAKRGVSFISGTRVRLEKLSLITYVDYDVISDIADGITGQEITKEYKKEYTYNGITFILIHTAYAKIPEEEMTLLKLLGKVEVSYNEPSVSESVFCEFG